MMSDIKNFRITLQLSHFFQDHRSLCKIFVNSKMQYISDLQNHIQNIFNIKNFYFLSGGHYIPPSEDIRILQRDDIIHVLPHHNINPPICSSTPVIGDEIASPVKGKRKRHVIENENIKDVIPFIQENSTGNEKTKKKKKKRKHEIHSNKELQILNDQEQVSENAHSDDVQNDTAKRKKKMKPQNIFPHLDCEKAEDAMKGNMNTSVKEKVSYFEGQSNVEEMQSTSETCKTADKIETTRQEDKSEDRQNSADYFRKKKLFVRKRSDIISYDLPKKSNIVQSILVSRNSMNETASAVGKSTEKIDTNCLGDNSKAVLKNIPTTAPMQEKLKYSICILKNSPDSVEKIDCKSGLNEQLERQVFNEIDFKKVKGKKVSLFQEYKPKYMEHNISKDQKNIIDDELHIGTKSGHKKFLDGKLDNTTHKEKGEESDFLNRNGVYCQSSNITKVKEIDKEFSKSVENDFAITNVTSRVKDSVNELSGSSSKPTGNDFYSMNGTSLAYDSVKEPAADCSKPTENDFCNMDVTSLVHDCANGPAGETGNNFHSMDVTALVKDSVNEQSSRDSSKPTGNDLRKMDVTSLIADYAGKNTKKPINSSSKVTESDFFNLDMISPATDSGVENMGKVTKRLLDTIKDIDVLTLTNDSANENLNKADSSKLIENDSAISLENNLCPPITPVDTIDISSEKEQSMLSESISSAPSENTPFEVTGFITKRKRKRSHRKRKTRSSTETATLPPNNPTEYGKKHIQTAAQPKIHIKFDDDHEPVSVNDNEPNMSDVLEKHPSPIAYTNNSAIKNRKTDADDAIIIDNLILRNERGEATNKRRSEANKLNDTGDCITILDDSSDNTNRESNEFGLSLISEEIISKSVLMVSMKPKCNDIIAFKILRLTENYTPEVSKYITGKILRVSENNSDVELKIIEGLDQCANPDGKFSLKNVDPRQKEQINIKTFCWSDLIEPRLIYP